MNILFEKSKKIFAMYSRLSQYLKEKDYQLEINSNFDKETIGNLISSVVIQRKNLFNLLISDEEDSIPYEEFDKKSEIDKYLKEYEIKLLKFLNENNEISEKEFLSFIQLLKKEKQSLLKIIHSLYLTEFSIPYSWQNCFLKDNKALNKNNFI